jgi:hypothetical protein
MSEHDLLGTFVPEQEQVAPQTQREYRWGVILATIALLATLVQAAGWGAWWLGSVYPHWWIVALAVMIAGALVWGLQRRGAGFASAVGRMLAAPFVPFVDILYTSFRPRRDVYTHLATVRLEDRSETVPVEFRDPHPWPEMYDDARYVVAGYWTRGAFGVPRFQARYAQAVDDDGFPIAPLIQTVQDVPVVLGFCALVIVACGSLLAYVMTGVL